MPDLIFSSIGYLVFPERDGDLRTDLGSREITLPL